LTGLRRRNREEDIRVCYPSAGPGNSYPESVM
jgi:hypothetical protein